MSDLITLIDDHRTAAAVIVALSLAIRYMVEQAATYTRITRGDLELAASIRREDLSRCRQECDRLRGENDRLRAENQRLRSRRGDVRP
jgi:hypothetical protein